MRRLTTKFSSFYYVLGLSLTLLIVACNDSGNIEGFGGSGGAFGLSQRERDDDAVAKKKKKKVRGGSRSIDVTDEGEDAGGDSAASSSEQASGEGDDDDDDETVVTPREYPVLEFQAKGFTTCKGDNYNTTAAIVTTVSESDFQINMVAARVHCGGRCQQKADEEIANSLGNTRYERTSSTQLKAAAKQGDFENAPFTIFANNVVKERQGIAYTFDKPIPVFPFPGPKGSYGKLDSGPLQWRANATGSRNFTVIVEITKLGEQGDDILLHYKMTIPEDQGRILYEDFPLPREAQYTVNMKTRDVREINSMNWFNGGKCDNNPETVALVYKMCKKTKAGVPETMPCD